MKVFWEFVEKGTDLNYFAIPIKAIRVSRLISIDTFQKKEIKNSSQ